ncbi:MAG: CapA family protein [Pelotomaculum sp.]|jgi:hypothetical protein
MKRIGIFGDILLADSVVDIGFGFTEFVEKQRVNYNNDLIPDLPAEIRVGNLEFVISCRSPHKGLKSRLHRTSPEKLQGFSDLPVEILSVANNHILNHGIDGYRETVSFLQRQGFLIIGDSVTPGILVEVGERKVGILSASLVYDKDAEVNKCYNYLFPIKPISKKTYLEIMEKFPAYNELLNRNYVLQSDIYMPQLDKIHSSLKNETSLIELYIDCYGCDILKNPIDAQIKELKQWSDYIIIYLHWGDEYVYSPASWQRKYSRLLSKNGADAIIGCHSHTVQNIEMIENVPVVYSLGNTYFHTNNLDAQYGEAVILEFRPEGIDARIIGCKFDEKRRKTEIVTRKSTVIAGVSTEKLSVNEYLSLCATGIDQSRRYKRIFLIKNFFKIPVNIIFLQAISYTLRIISRFIRRLINE